MSFEIKGHAYVYDRSWKYTSKERRRVQAVCVISKISMENMTAYKTAPDTQSKALIDAKSSPGRRKV